MIITYRPVARLSTITMLDISTAFLNGELKSEVYIKIPKGLDVKNKNAVLKLRRGLYGVKNVPKSWIETINSFLKSYVF